LAYRQRGSEKVVIQQGYNVAEVELPEKDLSKAIRASTVKVDRAVLTPFGSLRSFYPALGGCDGKEPMLLTL
jgi:hypothetical protein